MSRENDMGGFGIPPEVLNNITIPSTDETRTTTSRMPDDTTFVRAEIITNDEKEKLKWDKLNLNTQEAKVPRKINREIKHSFFDVEPRWKADNVTKRKSWPEFCRDFLGQNYGSIAQAMLELYQKDKTQFLKYMLEMGKQGYPQSMQLELSKPQDNSNDIYGRLQQMSNPLASLPTPNTEDNDNANPKYNENEAYVIDPDAEGIPEVEYTEVPSADECAFGNKDNVEQCQRCSMLDKCGMPIAHYAEELKPQEKENNQKPKETHRPYEGSDLFSQFSNMNCN